MNSKCVWIHWGYKRETPYCDALKKFEAVGGDLFKVVAAFLLAILGGNPTPSAVDIKTILASVGADVDEEKIELLMFVVKGKDVNELIASGRVKLASVLSGGGACITVAVTMPAANSAPASVAAKSKKKKKVEDKEEFDDENFFGSFDN